MAKEITGKKVLAFAVGAFGIIIGVNLVMAWQAVSTFPGLEVPNSYVASQSFDKERAAQEALGWTVEPSYENGVLSLVVRDKAGLRRLFLHAASLEFALDEGRAPYTISAPLAPELREVLDRLA